MAGNYFDQFDAPKQSGNYFDRFDTPSPPQQTYDPTEGMSATDKFLAGIGKGMTDLARGAGQRLGLVSQSDIDEARKLDAPLMNTTGGKVGNFVSTVAPAVVAAGLPGAQTLAGAAAYGAAQNLLQPTGTGESALKNAALGAGFGAAGYGAGKLIGAGINKLAESGAARAAANQGISDAAATARDAGYVIPPTQTNPSLMNRTLEGFAGKLTTGQQASLKNQATTNNLASRALGITQDIPITPDILKGIRSQAGDAYEALRGFGQITADNEYGDALKAITQKYQGAAKDFPDLAKNDIEAIVSSVNKPSFGSDSAVDAIRILRDKADTAFGSGDKVLGKAYRSTADAMEGLIDRNLQAVGDNASGLLGAFRNARQAIAKTYSVEKALNPVNGNVNAQILSNQLKRGAPLSGDLRTIAQAATAFPSATKTATSSMPGLSPLDLSVGAIGAAHGNPLTFLLGPGRMATRSLILSKPYQNIFAAPPGAGILGSMTPLQGQALTGLLSRFGGASLPRLGLSTGEN